jgi:hypothetical protein
LILPALRPLRWRFKQQRLRAGVQAFEPRRQRANLRVQQRQRARLLRAFAYGIAQCLRHGAQAGQILRALGGQAVQGLDERLGQHAARHAHARAAPALAPSPARPGGCALSGRAQRRAVVVEHAASEVLRTLAQLRCVARQLGELRHLHQRGHAQRAAREPLYPAQPAQVHAARELAQRRGGQVVRLVEHQQAVVQLGQRARAQRRQQQVVVHHDHLRAHELLALFEIAAVRERRTVFARARGRLGRHGRPELGLGRRIEGVAVAVPAATRERLRQRGVELLARLGRVVGLSRTRGGLLVGKEVVLRHTRSPHRRREPVELELAHVAPAPLGERELEGLRQARGQRGQVLVHELLLQRHRGRGDQHARVARQRQRHRRRAIRERLAHARTRLDHGDRTGGGGISFRICI